MQHLLPLYLVICILPGVAALTVLSMLATGLRRDTPLHSRVAVVREQRRPLRVVDLFGRQCRRRSGLHTKPGLIFPQETGSLKVSAKLGEFQTCYRMKPNSGEKNATSAAPIRCSL